MPLPVTATPSIVAEKVAAPSAETAGASDVAFAASAAAVFFPEHELIASATSDASAAVVIVFIELPGWVGGKHSE